MSGLRQHWGLGEAQSTSAGDGGQGERFRLAFLERVDRVNQALRYTAANSPVAEHQALVARRDKLFAAYIHVAGAETLDAASVERLLAAADRLIADAERLADSTREAKQRWESKAPEYEAAEDAVSRASEEEEEETLQLSQCLGRATEAAGRRDYAAACDELDQLTDVAADGAKGLKVPSDRAYDLSAQVTPAPQAPNSVDSLKDWKNPLIEVPPEQLFTPDKMDEVVALEFYEDDAKTQAELNTAMESLVFLDPDDERYAAGVATIGRIRGIREPELSQQLERFKQLRAVSDQVSQTRNLPEDETYKEGGAEYLKQHPDFLGSRSNLRFGHVVGEATGLDPAFAAMLNPTGGMVGPGMDHLAPTDADSPVVWHGIFHDAGGYLLNYQNSGPGYTYLADKQPESGRAGAHPWQGQVEGVSYWYERAGQDRSVLEDMLSLDKSESFYEAYVEGTIEDAEAVADNLTQEAIDGAVGVAEEARVANREAGEAMKETTREVHEEVDRAVAAAEESVDALAERAKEAGVDADSVEAAERMIDEQLALVQQQVEQWDRELTSAIDEVGATVDGEIDAFEQWSHEAGAAVQQRVRETADEAEEAARRKLIEVAGDEDLQEFLRAGVNRYGELELDARALYDRTQERIAAAEARAAQLFDEARARLEEELDAGSELLDQAREKLAGAGREAVDKLRDVRETTARGAQSLARRMDDAGRKLEQKRQEVGDAVTGVTDGMADAVDSATDTLANVYESATESASASLENLTNLLG